jgi:hypothetical protein
MPKWIDLADKVTGARLKVSRIEDNTYLFITGLSNKSGKWSAAIERLGFISGGNGRFLIRRVMPGERPGPADFRAVWPNARIVEMEPAEYLLDLTPRKKERQPEEREIVDETRNARRLGRNFHGEEVYESDLGRFIWRDRVGAVYESPGLAPALVLRALDAEGLQLCADGFVQAMRQGEVQHSEDFEAFRQAVGAADSAEQRSALHSAIDAALVRHLRREFDTAQDAYGESVRLYELLPPYSGAPRGEGAMPAPLSVLAQRLLGDTTGKRVLYPEAYDGAAFSFLPKGTLIKAFKGGKDLSGDAMGLVGLREGDVEWEDAFVAARHAGSDALFFNADPARDRAGERADLRSALMACRALADGGRAVLALAGDDPRQPGRLSAQWSGFLRTLNGRYDVEECCELGANLAQRVGTHAGLRLVSLRNRPPRTDAANRFDGLERLEVLHSWDEVKARVDEAIARSEVKEAQADSISVERATEVNRLQAPYLAFSRVGEARTMVPKNLQAPLQAALADVEEQYGPVDAFVESELGLAGENTLAERFSPEQIDAIALMISRIKRRRAPILADETGIGKGRTLAALCTWASKQGRPVVFITDRANLFSDLARDLRDIGEWGRFRPLITNSDGHIVQMVRPTTEDDEAAAPEVNVLAKATASAQMHEILQHNRALQELGVNIVFTTYSQIAGEDNEKATWVKNQLDEALLIVDESHIAAGSDSSIARQMGEMASIAWGVAFSSATWAKTPDNLHVYARAMPETVNVASLTETIRRGGEAFSEVFSTMLARDGALIRREHDLSRLEFVLEIDHVNLERNRQVADLVSGVMGQISIVSGEIDRMMVRLSRASVDALKAAREVRDAALGGGRRRAAEAGDAASIFRSAFGAGSMLYQVQRRMNAALNVDNVVRLALRALEEGRKPVIVFDETTEAFVRRAIERSQVFDAQGNPVRADSVKAPTLRDLMYKVVEDLATVRVSEVTWEEVQAAAAAGRDLVEEVADQALQQDAAAVEAAAGAAEQPGADGGDPPPAPGAEPEPGAERAPADDAAATGAGEGDGAGEGGDEVGRTAEDQANPNGAGVDVEEAVAAAQQPQQATAKPKKTPVRRVRLDQIPGLTEQQRRTFVEGLREIEAVIEQIPPIPISVADEVHRRLREAGLRTGEISGRTFMLEGAGGGMALVRTRNKSKLMVNRTVDGFNSHELDAVVINRSAATGLSLHASPRFIDHRRRELIEAQPPENPTERVQLYGRVNRYDQVSQPRVSIAATGIPGETRHLMMQNKKLAALNANVRSSRESHAIISSVTDLLTPIGREVCRQFFLDNPLYATRMAQDIGRIERREVDAASAFTRYVSLLPVAQQDMLYEQVNQLFEEAILKAELAGENPLKPKEHDWRARTVAQDVLFGIDHGGLGSAFDGPVYVRALRYEKELRPMTWEQVEASIDQARRRLIESGAAAEVGALLNEPRTPIISLEETSRKVATQLDVLARTALAATKFATTEEALGATTQNPVKRGMARKIWLQANLPRMVPGARISLPHPNPNWAKMGTTVPHVLVDIVPPKPGKEAMLAQWKLMLIAPGQEKPVPHSLNSLMTNVELLVFADPGRPGVVERDAINPVSVGADILMPGRAANQSRMIIDAFRNAPSGVRVRMASVLAGNMYMASEFASEAKVGQSVLYTDDRGMRQRAVLLGNQFEAAKLRYMPVRVWVRRAMEDFLLALSGLSADRVQIDEEGKEHPGAPPCQSNRAGAAADSAEFLLHTSFSRAWSYGITGNTSLSKDDLLVLPGQGIALVAGKEQHRRLMAALRAAQERIREEEAKQRRVQQGGQQPAHAVQVAAEVAGGDAATAGGAEAAVAGRTSARQTQKVRAADDPSHVVISGSERRGRRATQDAEDARGGRARGQGGEVIVLKADTSAKMRRVIRMLVEGTGLQIYVQRHHAVGEFARQVVRVDLVRRLRDEIGDQPEKLARLEEQIERMDTEAAATRRGFVDLARHGGVGDTEAQALVERNGDVIGERDLFEEEAAQTTAQTTQADAGQDAVAGVAEQDDPDEEEPAAAQRPPRMAA